jgi:hypothetical protein
MRIASAAVICSLIAVPVLADLSEYSVYAANQVKTGSQAYVEGLLGSGGNVSVGYDTTLLGGGRAGGHFNTGGSLGTPGDIIANGKITLPWDSVVGGDVIAGGKISLGGNVKPGGITQSGAGTPYSLLELPNPTIFTAGSGDLRVKPNGTLDLAPGTYGSLSTNNRGTVNLTAGSYFFDSINLGHAATINLDVSSGDIQIYTLDNMCFGSNVNFDVIGGSAKNIYMETHGDFAVGYSGQVYGTVYAAGSNGSSIRTGSNLDFYGALYSNDMITLDYQNTIHYELSDHFEEMLSPVPIPGAALLGILGLTVAGVRLRNRAFWTSS